MGVEYSVAQSKINEIARQCGNDTVKQTASYFGFLAHHSPNSLWFEIFDGLGFYFGNKAKTHFNLCEIAIVKEKQNRGYGTALLKRIKNICKENNINTITLRARKGSPAEKWWRSRGGVITGSSKDGKDWKMEIRF